MGAQALLQELAGIDPAPLFAVSAPTRETPMGTVVESDITVKTWSGKTPATCFDRRSARTCAATSLPSRMP